MLCFLFQPPGGSGDSIAVLCSSKHSESENSPDELQPADLSQAGVVHGWPGAQVHQFPVTPEQLFTTAAGGRSRRRSIKVKTGLIYIFFRHLFAEVTVMDVLFFIARREWILHYLSVIKIKQSQGNMNIRKMNVWYWGVLCLFVLVLSLYHSAGQWRCFKYDCKPVGPTTG